MSTLIKYLSLEAIENTASCLNYKLDKVVFFGLDKIINEEESNISRFLSKYCDCLSEFISIDNKTYEEICELLKNIINEEKQCYFDFTGDEGVFEAAAFKVANELDIPTSTFDVWNRKLIVIKKNIKGNDIETLKRASDIKLNIKSYVEMIGGKVVIESPNHKEKIDTKLIEIRKKYGRKWTSFSSLIASCKQEDVNRFCCEDINRAIQISKVSIDKDKVLEIIEDLDENGFIDLSVFGKNCFMFDSEEYGPLIAEGGAILEQIVYSEEKEKVDDCAIGMKFKWDDEEDDGFKVRNEIDVVTLKDYVLTFISCKDKDMKRDYLYELESVTRGFAGNYTHMKLVTTVEPGDGKKNLLIRGKELGIEIIYQKL